jgi:hypothetical protein
MPTCYRDCHYVERSIQYPRHRGGDSYQRILLPAVAAHLAIAFHACDLGNDVPDLATGSLLWIFYGIMISAWPIVLANLVTALQAFAILWMKLRFPRCDAECKRLQS